MRKKPLAYNLYLEVLSALFHSHPSAASDLFRKLNKLFRAQIPWSRIELSDDGAGLQVGHGLL